MSSQERRLTDLELERWLADDLPVARVAVATAADRARLELLRAERDRLLNEVDVSAQARAIERRLRASVAEPSPRRAPRWLAPSLAAVAASVAIAVGLGLWWRGEGVQPDSLVGIKGDVALVVYRAGEAGGRRLASGDSVLPGDSLRFEVRAGRAGYVAVVGVDESGGATVYYPYAGSAPAAYEPTAALLPGAIELDATLGRERVYALFAAAPFDLTRVVEVLRNGEPSRLPVAIQWTRVELSKRPR